MNYAIVENGTVINIISLYERNAAEFPGAVKLDGRPVVIGDAYDGETFYHNGEKVLTELEAAQAIIADMQAALNTLGVTVDG